MKLVRLIELLRSHLKLVLACCCAALGGLIVIDLIFVSKEHAHTLIEHLPGFWSIFGFLGCVVIIIASKWFGHTGIMTREDYYDE